MSMPGIIDRVHAAIVARLKADTALMTILKGVWDDVPDSQAYPYVQMGDPMQTPEDVFGNQGRVVVVTLHVWSRYQGQKETSAVLKRIAELLDRHQLAVTGAVVVRCTVESENIMRDPDGRTRHGVATYRIEASET